MSNIIIKATKAPNLPIPTIAYSQTQQETFSNALRLYFNTLDAFTVNLSNTNGGSSLSTPHIGASDTTSQEASGNDTPTIVKWNTLDSSLGFSLASNKATASYSGVYKIDYSLQYANTANAAHDVDVWLKINNIDVPRSTSKISLPARKSSGAPSYVLMYSTVMFTLNAGDNIELYWATDQAYKSTAPTAAGVYMEYKAAQTIPFAHPSIPSAIGTITFVSRT